MKWSKPTCSSGNRITLAHAYQNVQRRTGEPFSLKQPEIQTHVFEGFLHGSSFQKPVFSNTSPFAVGEPSFRPPSVRSALLRPGLFDSCRYPNHGPGTGRLGRCSSLWGGEPYDPQGPTGTHRDPQPPTTTHMITTKTQTQTQTHWRGMVRIHFFLESMFFATTSERISISELSNFSDIMQFQRRKLTTSADGRYTQTEWYMPFAIKNIRPNGPCLSQTPSIRSKTNMMFTRWSDG